LWIVTKEASMLTIFVGWRKQFIGTEDEKTMKVYPLLVKANGKYQYLNDQEFSDVADVELIVTRWFIPFLGVRIRLTSKLKKGIITFLNEYHAKQYIDFDCYSFAELVENVNQEKLPESRSTLWQPRHRVLRRKVGDIIFMRNHKEKNFHAAIYIGLGLYLSVYGAGGDLEVATLRDMKRDFKTPELRYVTLNSEAATK